MILDAQDAPSANDPSGTAQEQTSSPKVPLWRLTEEGETIMKYSMAGLRCLFIVQIGPGRYELRSNRDSSKTHLRKTSFSPSPKVRTPTMTPVGSIVSAVWRCFRLLPVDVCPLLTCWPISVPKMTKAQWNQTGNKTGFVGLFLGELLVPSTLMFASKNMLQRMPFHRQKNQPREWTD